MCGSATLAIVVSSACMTVAAMIETVIMPRLATGAEFSVLPAQNASGNWVKVVQRIPVRLHVTNLPADTTLRAGMSAVVEIDTGHRRGLFTVLSHALALDEPAQGAAQ